MGFITYHHDTQCAQALEAKKDGVTVCGFSNFIDLRQPQFFPILFIFIFTIRSNIPQMTGIKRAREELCPLCNSNIKIFDLNADKALTMCVNSEVSTC